MKNYTIYRGTNVVAAVRHYKGKTVRGVAKCAPNDEFDLGKGTKLAELRCEQKIAKMRLRSHQEMVDYYTTLVNDARKWLNQALEREAKAEKAFNEITFELENYISTL